MVDGVHVADENVGGKTEAKCMIETGVGADDAISSREFSENASIRRIAADDDDGVIDDLVLGIDATGHGRSRFVGLLAHSTLPPLALPRSGSRVGIGRHPLSPLNRELPVVFHSTCLDATRVRKVVKWRTAAAGIDVANVVLWLVGDGAGYVTGQRIEVDGGGSR